MKKLLIGKVIKIINIINLKVVSYTINTLNIKCKLNILKNKFYLIKDTRREATINNIICFYSFNNTNSSYNKLVKILK